MTTETITENVNILPTITLEIPTITDINIPIVETKKQKKNKSVKATKEETISVKSDIPEITIPKVEIVIPEKISITLTDYQNIIEDSHISEEELIRKYRFQLWSIDAEGKLPEYEEKLKLQKKTAQLKLNAYQSITIGKMVTKDYWDKILYPYFVKINYPINLETDIKETLEDVLSFDKKTNEKKITQVLKVSLTNNLKTASKEYVPYMLDFIIENFNLDEKTKNDFEVLKTQLKTEKHEDILKGHTVKANSEIIEMSTKRVLKDMEVQNIENSIYIDKNKASINFINWKLGQIKIFKGKLNLKKAKIELSDLNIAMEIKIREDKKFSSLVSIARKFKL